MSLNDYWDTPSPEYYKRLKRTAKKQYKCCECGRDINPGDKYEYAWGIWGNKQLSYRTCMSCVSARDLIKARIYYWAHGHLIDDIQQEMDETEETDELFLKTAKSALELIGIKK